MRLVDALLKGLEERGFRVAPGPTVTILDIEIKFSMAEVLDVQQKESDNFEFEGRYQFGHSRFDQKRVPSGRLVLQIHDADRSSRHGCRKSWRDGDKAKLEDCLNKFVGGLLTFAARSKEHQNEQERQAEQRREDEVRREEEARQRAERRKQYSAERAPRRRFARGGEQPQTEPRAAQLYRGSETKPIASIWSDRAR